MKVKRQVLFKVSITVLLLLFSRYWINFWSLSAMAVISSKWLFLDDSKHWKLSNHHDKIGAKEIAFKTIRKHVRLMQQDEEDDAPSSIPLAPLIRPLDNRVNTNTNVDPSANNIPLSSSAIFPDIRNKTFEVETNTTFRQQRVLYIVTPTYARPTQQMDLLRLSQTLQLASDIEQQRIYWILIEDSPNCTSTVRDMALQSRLSFAHIAVSTPPNNKKRLTHKGINQRNAALELITNFAATTPSAEGVVYFADDDNAYHVQLFTELSYVTNVGVLGVGLVGSGAYERCVVNPQTGLVEELLSSWTTVQRTYPVDMAGFAFSSYYLTRHLLLPTTTIATQPLKLRFRIYSKPGFLESDFIQQMVASQAELQPLAGNCSRILVWHVKTIAKEDNATTITDGTIT